MKEVRVAIASILFYLGVFLCVLFFYFDYHGLYLLAGIVCFISVMFIWPKRKRKEEVPSFFVEKMMNLFEAAFCPIEILFYVFRVIFTLFAKLANFIWD